MPAYKYFATFQSWWIRLALLFCKKQYSIDYSKESDDYSVCIVTKELNGKLYITDHYIIGAQHEK